MSKQNGYIGRSPGDSAVIIASQTFEPTGIQTDFTFASGYTVGYLDVYFNGARLVYANDYTATNGSSVGLTTYANNGDVLELVAYKAFNVGNVQEAAGNFSVGNQLTVVGATTATTAYYTGVVTATTFSGALAASSLTGALPAISGANLTNLPPSAPVGGASTNQVFFENDKLVEVNYQITSTKNAMSAGPISISAGIAVTVPSGCSWTIV